MQSDAEKPEHPSDVIATNTHINKQPVKSHVFHTVHWEMNPDATQFTVTHLLDWLVQQESMLHEFCLELFTFFILYANFSSFHLSVIPSLQFQPQYTVILFNKPTRFSWAVNFYYCTSWLLYVFRALLAPIIRSTTTVYAASGTSTL